MSISSKPSLSIPAVKCFVKQLDECFPNVSSDSGVLPFTMTLLNGNRINIRVVWLQGRVESVAADGESFKLNDGTSSCLVTGFRHLSSGCPVIGAGMYMMVIGELKLGCGEPVMILATKIQDLSDVELNESVWMYEIVDSFSTANG